jgi:hypothetical protein
MTHIPSTKHAQGLRGRLAEMVRLALEGAPLLLTVASERSPPQGRPPSVLDLSFRALLISLAEALGGVIALTPRGLARVLRQFLASHDAPTPAQGGSARVARLWPWLFAAAAELERCEGPRSPDLLKAASVREILTDLLAVALQAVSDTMRQAGAVDRARPALEAPRWALDLPPLTQAQCTYDLVAVAQAAVSALASRSPDPALALERLADTLGYVELASTAPLTSPLQRLARCGQALTAEEETRDTVVWLDDDPSAPNTTPVGVEVISTPQQERTPNGVHRHLFLL